MRGILCTNAPVRPQGHGGGSSSFYELAALANVCCETPSVLHADPGIAVRHFGCNPFIVDYCASMKVTSDMQFAEVAIFNGAPWGATMRRLMPDFAVADVPANDNAVSREEFEAMIGPYPYRHQCDPELWPLYSQFISDADVVIVQAKQSIGYLNCPVKRVEVVPGGCHLPEAVVPMPDQFRVGYIGALGSDKGVAYLIRAWAGLMLPDTECVFAGADSPKTQPAAERYPRAHWRIWGYADPISDFYNALSVYVQPSVTEGFGLPVLEAMAHGRPVIVTTGAGAHELVTDQVNGLVIPPRNSEALADAIRWCYDNPARLRVMGEAARTLASEYTWGRAQREYERIIKGGIGA